jgi:hypothetical protein
MRPRRPAFCGRIERLEDRWTPAGVLTALLSGGNLTILGDNLANGLTITQSADSRLVLTPTASTQIRLGTGGIPQSGALTLPYPLTDNVFARLYDGDDVLSLSGVTLPSSLGIDGGHGNNTVSMTNVVAQKDIAIENRIGNDRTNLFSEVTVLGKLSIQNGDGGSLVDDNASTTLRVAKDFVVRNGTGADVIDLDDAQSIHVGGQLRVDHAFGSPDITNSDTRFDTRAGGLVLGGVELSNGRGNDNVRFDSDAAVTIEGLAVVRNGDGGSTTVFASSTNILLGSLIVSNGSGADTTTIGGNTTPTVRVADRLSVDHGHGGGTVTIGGGNASLFVGGMTRLSAGLGADNVAVGSNLTPDVTLGTVSIDAGDDANSITVSGSRLHVNGRLAIRGGTGTDLATVTSQARDGTITGDVSIDLGRGDNQRVTLQAATNGMLLNIGQTLAISTDDVTTGGTDTITLLRVGVRGRTSIVTGIGSDNVAMDDCELDALVLRTGAGNDTVNIDRGAFNATTRFYGHVAIFAGAGDDLVQLGTAGGAGTQVVFATTCHLDGGPGRDTLTMLFAGNVLSFGGSLVTEQFEIMN